MKRMKDLYSMMLFSNLLCVIVPLMSLNAAADDPETTMNAIELIRYYGYPAEEHNVTTADGYINTMHRIPHGRNNNDSSIKRKPVLLMHGILEASTCWLLNPPNGSLGFILADKGYDVWLGNYRGNTYGRQHTTLDPNSKEFWLFNFDQMALYDLPAIMDFVLNKTGFEQLHYVGHSMGTTTAFILLSNKTEYNAKIRSFNALAPVTKFDYTKCPFVIALGPISNQLSTVAYVLGGYEVLPSNPVFGNFTREACESKIGGSVCSTVLFSISGVDYDQMNESRVPVYLHFIPAGASAQTLQHNGQIYNSKRFQYYDYGDPFKNEKAYGQIIPPIYEIEKITAPVALYWGDNDWLAQPADVAYAVEKLPNTSLVLNYRVPFEKWNHFDFLWARDVGPLLYDKLIETMEKLWP